MRPQTVAALVVGGSGAVGLEVVNALRTRGLRVIATARQAPAASHDGVRWISWDSIEDFPSQLHLDESERLGVLVYCVGIPSSKLRVLDTSPDEAQTLLAVNSIGFLKVVSSIRSTIRQHGTSIVVLGSDASDQLRPLNGAYAASKRCLEALVLTLGFEEREHGVRANVVSPSLIESKMGDRVLQAKGIKDLDEYKRSQPGGRIHTPQEIAALIASIACDPEWSLANSQVISVGPLRV